jgi:hypothetical protein
VKVTSTSSYSRPIFKASNRFAELRPTPVYDTYWRFAAKRQAIYMRRVNGVPPPWTTDPILLKHKFTNAYRASDRVSQYFIRHVLYAEKYSSEPKEIVFRTLLFKLFNKVSTWERLETALGGLSWATFDLRRYDRVLSATKARGEKLYSAAYIVPPVRLGPNERVKHRGHLHLLAHAMNGDLTNRLLDAPSLKDVYGLLKGLPSFGPFLAFQFAVDLNYSTALAHQESDFVVAGPGALDGISKCFVNAKEYKPEGIIEFVQDRQIAEFARLGIEFTSLWGRPLQLIDCQNLFCELSKYSRVAHPEFSGIAGRTKIKQMFRPASSPVSAWFPPKWGINTFIWEEVVGPSDDLFAVGAKQ